MGCSCCMGYKKIIYKPWKPPLKKFKIDQALTVKLVKNTVQKLMAFVILKQNGFWIDVQSAINQDETRKHPRLPRFRSQHTKPKCGNDCSLSFYNVANYELQKI